MQKEADEEVCGCNRESGGRKESGVRGYETGDLGNGIDHKKYEYIVKLGYNIKC